MSEQIKVLIVDDSLEMLELLGDVVSSEGYEPCLADTAFQALKYMESNSFHAAVVDVVLPDINGIELMKKLRKIDPHIAPIVVTGNGDLKSAVEALNEGAEEYLLKPLNIEELRAILSKVISRRKALEQTRYLQTMLRQSEEKYRKSVYKLDEAVILVDTARAHIIDANSEAENLTGSRIQNLLRKTLFDLFPAAVHSELREIIKKIKRRNQDMFSHLSIQRDDGTRVPIEAHCQIVEYSTARLIQFMFQSIAERKEYEEKKWRSQRFTTFNEIAGIAKDQISSPLTAILGQTEVLRSRLKTRNSSVIESLRSIEEQVNRVQLLFDNLQDFAALQSGSRPLSRRKKPRARKLVPKSEPRISKDRKHRILVVDDEPAMREVLEDFFTMNSFDVVTSEDGHEGLRKFKSEKVDLVVTDLTMPRLDGVGLLKEIKNQDESVPVILMTGLNINQVDGIAEEYGADGYIMKPFSFYQIMKLVQDVLTRKSTYAVS